MLSLTLDFSGESYFFLPTKKKCESPKKCGGEADVDGDPLDSDMIQ